MKDKVRLEVMKVFNQESDVDKVVDNILVLFGVKNLETPNRGCCSECGEGYDNDKEWVYNTECGLCGHPIPEHLINK